MEIFDLAEKKKALAPPELRYQHPHEEAMKLRLLWMTKKPLTKSEEMREARGLYKQAQKLIQSEDDNPYLIKIIKKGLFLHPRFHGFYGLDGEISRRKGKLSKAIRCLEFGRHAAKFDVSISGRKAKHLYNDQLIDCYTERGNWYYDNKRLSEALGDYEQVFQLKSSTVDTVDVQDKLLMILRVLKKYELFQRYWNQFAKSAEGDRLSDLLTMYADYKIYFKEMGMARRMLLKALELNKDNAHAHESLQVVYSAGHALIGFAVLWCMHGCYDKGLISLEKALDTNPFNPGFTMLKVIVLRLSGRLDEATTWLRSVSRSFSKLLDPTDDIEESILGTLSVRETRHEMIKQWYLIQYDKAMQYMLQDKLETAAYIIYKSKLTTFFPESYVLLGDCFLRRGEFDLALESYLKYRKMAQESQSIDSEKDIDVMQRIIDILNDCAHKALKGGRSKDAIKLADRIIQILNEDELTLNKLGVQRGQALLNKTRATVQLNQTSKVKDQTCCETAAEGLVFLRDPNDTGLYRSFYGDRPIEETIDRFTPKRKLPRSLKILMQYS